MCGLVFLWLVTILSYGQTTFSQKYGTEEDHKRLYFLNLQYTQSWARSDTATYNQLLWAEDFVHISSADGALFPKKALSPRFGTPRFEKLNYFYPENTIIQFITNDAAMVYSSTRLGLAGQATEIVGQYNDVYLKRNGKWICVAANTVSPAKQGDPQPTCSKLPERTPLISLYNGSEDDKRALEELNSKHAEAFARSKSELVENILANDYTLQEANGLLYKKQEVLNRIRNQAKNNILESYSIENMSIRFVAADIAMIYAVFAGKMKSGNTSAIQYNDIYVKRENKWVCVSGNNASIRN